MTRPSLIVDEDFHPPNERVRICEPIFATLRNEHSDRPFPVQQFHLAR